MSNRGVVEEYLKEQPLFRERKNKNRGLVNLMLRRYPALRDIPKHILIDFLSDAATLDRWWRKILEEQPELRGTDYEKKNVLEQEREIELGYSATHGQDQKKLNTLF